MSVIETDISLNLSTNFPSLKIKPEITSKKNIVRQKIDFLFCGSCFWCASYFNNYIQVVTKCPSCSSSNVESMPISNDEVYTFSHNRTRGITLKFSKPRDVMK
jgi:hypothetical protein